MMDGKINLQSFVGKRVVIYFNTSLKPFRYEGKLIDIEEGMLIVDDIKEGVLAIPMHSCLIREVKDG